MIKLILAGVASVSFVAGAATPRYGPYNVSVDRILDGDTFAAVVAVWPGLEYRVNIRVAGIDTPELKAKSECERAMALSALNRATELLREAQIVTVDHIKYDSFAGRMVADVYVDGKSFGHILLSENHARLYKERQRGALWCVDQTASLTNWLV